MRITKIINNKISKLISNSITKPTPKLTNYTIKINHHPHTVRHLKSNSIIKLKNIPIPYSN